MTKQELAALRERLEMHSDPVYAASHPDSTDSAMLRAAGAIRDYEAALEAMETAEKALADLIALADAAMKVAAYDGYEYDREAELADARLALAALRKAKEVE